MTLTVTIVKTTSEMFIREFSSFQVSMSRVHP